MISTFNEDDRIPLLRWIHNQQTHCNINGRYFEFGVFRGRSFIKAYSVFGDRISKYIGFDSFQGLPELSKEDVASSALYPGFVAGAFNSRSSDIVAQLLVDGGIPEDKFTLYSGFFEDSLTSCLQNELNPEDKIAIVHMDVDLYSSSIQALDFVAPFLQTGTWLLCDDYWCYSGASTAGTHKALIEFKQKYPGILLHDYCNYRGWSKAFIIECL